MSRKSGEPPGDDVGRGPGAESAEEPQDPGFANLMNSFSLDSGRSRKRRRRGERPVPPPPAAPPPVEQEPVLAAPPPEPVPAPQRAALPPEQPEFDADLEDPATLVRPYTWTGGRTKSTLQLELETLVLSNEETVAGCATLQREHRLIATLCRHPHSVAEVAAKLAVPLGVARVLLSDMAEQKLVSVHTTPGGSDRAAHFTIMERVLSGLRRL